MRKLVIAVLLLSGITAFGQSGKFGIKGGFNFGATGDITDISNQNFEADNKVGYHLGVLAKLKFAGIFLQPEIVYTRLTADYKNTINVDADYTLSKLDVPVLVGIDIIGPLSLKAGPAFQLVLNNELDSDGFDAGDPKNSFTIGYQIGAGLQLGRLGVDLRYENAFSENDTSVTSDFSDIADAQFTIDSRPKQWILSVSYMLDRGNKK
ncbi:MAG: hypothetical protein ACI828_000385 [Flavobacteriales bacterium]|jgi:hypothetical protein